MKTTILYQNGLHITDISVQHSGRICIMSGGSGGEFCIYIPADAEPELLKALQKSQKHWLKRLFPKTVDNRKHEIVRLIVEKFSSKVKDPDADITQFLKDHHIKYASEYWPNR